MTQISIKVSVKPPIQPPARDMRRVRRWGDPVMIDWGFDVRIVKTSNFQAVRCYNTETGFGAVTNYLRIPHAEVMKLRAMQFDAVHEGRMYTRDQKMEWLCSHRGSIYMYDSNEDDWRTAPFIRWGTLTLGGNLVQVAEYRDMFLTIDTAHPTTTYRMARLVGFGPQDWNRPLSELLAEGLVHRAYCAYFPANSFGDSPKGIVYTPFFSPRFYDFAGSKQPKDLWIPEIWLEPR